MRHPRRLTRRVSFVGTRRLRRSSWTTTIAPTTSSWRHIQSSVWIRVMVCSQMVSTVQSTLFMSKRSCQSHCFLLTASSADGKDTASVRDHLCKYNDGATRWELQRPIIGYLNDHRDRAWRPCQVLKENKPTWKVFCLALDLDLRNMMERSRAMVRATRVDDAFDMLCPNPKDSRRPHDLHARSSDRAKIAGRSLRKRSWTNGAGGSYSFIAHCARLGENVNDFVERLLDEGALAECSGTGERVCTFGDSFSSASFLFWSCAITFAFWKRLARCIWSASDVVMSYAQHCVLCRRSSRTTSSRLQASLQTL